MQNYDFGEPNNEHGIKRYPEERFEIMGPPRPGKPFSLHEHLRFQRVVSHLAPGSVLDVGAYFGDFLKAARAAGHEIAGTEVNQARCDTANEALGEKVVVEDFRHGCLAQFGDRQFDNVVCMEVIEHLPDDRIAVHELCRVANKRVIVTVPFDERIIKDRCIHCGELNPRNGHLRKYDFDTFQTRLPESGWKLAANQQFGHRRATRLAGRFPGQGMQMAVGLKLDRWLCARKSARATWLLAILERTG